LKKGFKTEWYKFFVSNTAKQSLKPYCFLKQRF